MGANAIEPVGAASAPVAHPVEAPPADPGAFSSALIRAVTADQLPRATLAEMASSWSPSTRVAAISVPGLFAAAHGGVTSAANVPPELRVFGNGRIPSEALQAIGIGQHRMWGPAADAFVAMRAAAAADGVEIGVTDSYRSYAQQVELAERKGLYRDGGYAAAPGTSQHGWGLALDVDVTPSGLAWMRANAARFGFVEAVPREPWHWEYHG